MIRVWQPAPGLLPQTQAPLLLSLHVWQALNEQFSGQLHQQLGRGDVPVDEAVFISIDRTGADVRLRKGGEYCVQRLSFRYVCPFQAQA